MKNPFAGLFRARDKPRDVVSAATTFSFGGSSAGKSVTPRNAIQVSVVYACVRVIAETIASLPFAVFEETDKGSVKAPDHPLYQLPAAGQLDEIQGIFGELQGIRSTETGDAATETAPEGYAIINQAAASDADYVKKLEIVVGYRTPLQQYIHSLETTETCMTRNDLFQQLKAQISPAERAALRDDTIQNISRYNRMTLLRILECKEPDYGRMDAGRVEALHVALREYLNRYMPDTPEAHKWIILSCLFLAFVAMEPMHPQAIVGWKKIEDGYLCPSREEGGICQWCVCR